MKLAHRNAYYALRQPKIVFNALKISMDNKFRVNKNFNI